MENDNPIRTRRSVRDILTIRFISLYQRGALVLKKYGPAMGIFVLWWAVMGHVVIPYLLVRSDWWMFSWVTYGPFDEMLLFPIAAYFLMRGKP